MDRELSRKKLALLREEKNKDHTVEPDGADGASLIRVGGFQLFRSQGPVVSVDSLGGDSEGVPPLLRYEACFFDGWQAGESCAYRLIAGTTTQNPKGLSMVNSCSGTIMASSLEELESQLFKVASDLKPNPLLGGDFEHQSLSWDTKSKSLKGSGNLVVSLIKGDDNREALESPSSGSPWHELCRIEIPKLHDLFDPSVQRMREKPAYVPGQPFVELEKQDAQHRQLVLGSFLAGVKSLETLASFQRQKKAACPQCSKLVNKSDYLNAGENSYNLCRYCFLSYFNFSSLGNYHGSDDDYDDYERRMTVDSIVRSFMSSINRIERMAAEGRYRNGKTPQYPTVGDEIMRIYFAGIMLNWDYFVEESG